MSANFGLPSTAAFAGAAATPENFPNLESQQSLY
jgi:hypothetical protein